MAHIAQSGRAKLNVAVQRVLATDLVSGTPFNIFSKLPNGTIPVAAQVLIVVPFNTATSAVLDVGRAAGGNATAPIAASGNAYHDDMNLKAAAGTRVSLTSLPSIVNDASGGLQVTGTLTGVGAVATAGEILVLLTYAEDGVETHSQG